MFLVREVNYCPLGTSVAGSDSRCFTSVELIAKFPFFLVTIPDEKNQTNKLIRTQLISQVSDVVELLSDLKLCAVDAEIMFLIHDSQQTERVWNYQIVESIWETNFLGVGYFKIQFFNGDYFVWPQNGREEKITSLWKKRC